MFTRITPPPRGAVPPARFSRPALTPCRPGWLRLGDTTRFRASALLGPQGVGRVDARGPAGG